MRPHRSRVQLGTMVCMQVGEAVVYQIRRHQAGSRRLIRSAASAARETVNAPSSYAPAKGKSPELSALKDQIAAVVGGLTGAAEDLQEISRGIHPAIR
jgi:hypothetical protein